MHSTTKRSIVFFILGSVLTYIVSAIYYWDRSFTAADLSDAYERGQSEALKISPPSERLEIVCAALWFHTNATGIK